MKTDEKHRMFDSVVQEAWENPGFKAQLIADPVATLEKFLGRALKLPEGKNIAFVDQSDPNTLFINIPAKPDVEDVELNEDQLDAVVGGADPIITLPDKNFDSIL